MQYTEKLKLRKPESTDFYSIEDFNENAEILERAKAEIDSNISDVAYVTELALNKTTNHISNKSNPHNVTKAQVGLDKVDNTADIDKPVSILQQKALEEVESKGMITDTATGEHITISNSADAPVRSLRIDGKTEQFTTTGKNLLIPNNEFAVTTTNGITFTPIYKDGIMFGLNVKGTATEDTHTAWYGCYNTTIGEKFIFSQNKPTVDATMYLLKLNGSYDWISGETNICTPTSATETVVYAYVKKGVTIDHTFYPMIRLASVTDETYEPYTNGASPNPNFPQDIKGIGESGNVEVTVTGKNLFDKTKANSGNYLTSDGVINTLSSWAISDYIPVKPNAQYILSGSTNLGTNTSVCWYDDGKNYIGGVKYNKQDTVTITTSSDAKYIRCSCETTKFDNFQIEEGTVATEYEPYKSQTVSIPMDSAFLSVPTLYEGDTAIVKDGGIDYVRHYETVVFDGSDDEKWVVENIPNGALRASTNILRQVIKYPLDNYTVANILCDRFITERSEDTWQGKEGIGVQSNGFLQILYKDITSLSEWKTWLSQNPITVVYELAEPKIETYNKDIDLSTYKNVTHISNSENANMEVEYFVDSANGNVVVDLQKQVKNTTSYLNDMIVVENFEINESEIKIPPNDRYDIELPVNKDGYIPVMATLSFDTDPVPVSITSCKILGNQITGYSVFGCIHNIDTGEMTPFATVTVLYVKAQ